MAASYMRPYWRELAALSGLLLLGIVLQLVAPLIVRAFIDTATLPGPARLHALMGDAFLYIGIGIVTQVIAVAETYMAESVAWSTTNHLRRDVARHCLRLDLSFHHQHAPGEMIERVDGDVTVLENFFSRFVSAVIGQGLLLLGLLIVLFGIDWHVGLSLMVFTIAAIGLLNYLRGVGHPAFQAYRQARAELLAFLDERLAATEDIRANGAVGQALDHLHRLQRHLYHKETIALLLSSSTMWATTSLLVSIGTALTFSLGATLFQRGAITIGTVYLIFNYTQQLMRPLGQLSDQLQDVQQAGASISRLDRILRLRPTIQDGPGVLFPLRALAVAFDGVYFAYCSEDAVLCDISFHLAPGRSLGVVGRTGSGKTTLARLLLRFYDPTSGAIRLDGHDIRAARLVDLRRRVSLVTQDVHIFHATVRDNITVFASDVPDEAILHALRQLGLWEWYQQLPQGLETVLIAGGGGLSGGQAQLLALTRVFLLDPGVVILDEASSRLDPLTERLIERALRTVMAGRTCIIIAHRLATLRHVDDVLILRDGAVGEYGPREDLMRSADSHSRALLQVEPGEVAI